MLYQKSKELRKDVDAAASRVTSRQVVFAKQVSSRGRTADQEIFVPIFLDKGRDSVIPPPLLQKAPNRARMDFSIRASLPDRCWDSEITTIVARLRR